MGIAQSCLSECLTHSASNALTQVIKKASLKINGSSRYRAGEVAVRPLDSSSLISRHIGINSFVWSGVGCTEREKNNCIKEERIFFNFPTRCFIPFSEVSATFCCWTMIPDKPRMRSPFSLIFRTCCILSEDQLLKKIYAHSELSYLHFSVARTAKIAQLSKGPHSPALLCLCRLNAMKTITPSALLLLAAEVLFCMHLPCVCCCVFTDKCMKALF